jgi:anti-sigma B factor antagonist
MILTVNKKHVTPEIGLAELRGRLLMGNDSRQVEWAIAEFLKEGVRKVVLDLSEVDTMDSTGVGILVMCHAKLQKEKGDLRIVSKQGIVHDTLLMTHVDRIVQFFPTLEDATKGF